MPPAFGKSRLGSGQDRYNDHHDRLIDGKAAMRHAAEYVSINRPKA
jgi:hypothetical protein